MAKLSAQMTVLADLDSNLPVNHPHLHICEIERHCILRLQTTQQSLADDIARQCGIPEMPKPGYFQKTKAGLTIVWASRMEWLIFASLDNEESLIRTVASQVGGGKGCLTQISDSRVIFSIKGGDAPDWLAKNCTFDTDINVFRVGMASTARFNQYAAMILHVEHSSYRIYFDAPLACYIAKVMIEAAREFA